VKASVEDAYWEMLRLRKQMAIAKLGISISWIYILPFKMDDKYNVPTTINEW
jgi:hypothetical protein